MRPLMETRVGASTAVAMATTEEETRLRRRDEEEEEEEEEDKGDDDDKRKASILFPLLRRTKAAEAEAATATERGCTDLLSIPTSALVLAVHVATPRMVGEKKYEENCFFFPSLDEKICRREKRGRKESDEERKKNQNSRPSRRGAKKRKKKI